MLRGQAALPVELLVREIKCGHIRLSQAGRQPQSLVIKIRPLGQAERGRLQAVKMPPRVHAKLTPRLIAGLDVTQAGTLQIQSRQVILVSAEVSTVEFDPAACLRLSCERHLAKPDRSPFCHAPMLAKN